MSRLRDHPLPDPPAAEGVRDGLAYALFTPEGPPAGGIVVLHGAGSRKENHFDFARAARGAGFAAVVFDQRGHGASEGALDGRIVDDVATIAELLPDGPLALRGSSMGGYVALCAAAQLDAAGVVAICPASAEQLLRGLRQQRYEFRADDPALGAFLEHHDLGLIVPELSSALMLLHAEGDEQVPIAHSTELYRSARMPLKRMLAVPGGHHRSIQHDGELQGESLRFVAKAFATRAG